MRLGAGDSQRRSAHTLAAAEHADHVHARLHSARRWRSSQLPLGAPGQVPARRRRRSPRLPHTLPATEEPATLVAERRHGGGGSLQNSGWAGKDALILVSYPVQSITH